MKQSLWKIVWQILKKIKHASIVWSFSSPYFTTMTCIYVHKFNCKEQKLKTVQTSISRRMANKCDMFIQWSTMEQ